MPKKPEPQENTSEIIQTPLEDVLHQSMMPYAEHVILERALPRVEDGLKPVQRRILYTMHELGMTPDKPYRKCARIVGDCLGKYHPHGDSSVYDATVRMAQDFSMRGPLVDGHGNFGSIDGDSAAAMRYTEARMAPLAMEMLSDIQKDTVPFRLNFDDTLSEPDLLPARYPNLLVNGASGIAVGLATNIPPHNLKEAVAAVCLLIDKPDASTEDLMRVMPAPDFPTGGILLDTPEIRAAFETGRGKLTLRAKVHFEQGRAGRNLICITEVPYQVNKAQMLEKILRVSEEKKAAFSGIYDIRDESDRTGLRAVIELKKEADPEQVLGYLYKYSDMQITFGVNLVAIAEGKPALMGIREVIRHYINHQKDVVTRRSNYELERARARAHILDGLIMAVDSLDEILALIRSSKNGKEAKDRLMARFGFTDIQAQAILDLRLQRLTGLEILTLRKEHEEVLASIRGLEAILGSEKKLMSLIKKEMSAISERYGDERRTEILSESQTVAASAIDETVEAQEAVVFFTRGGQLRRMSPRAYDKLELPEAQGDMPLHTFRADTEHTLLFFTNLGNCYTLPVSKLEESNRPKDRGLYLSGLLNGLEDKEVCVSLFDTAPGELQTMPDLLFYTRQGQVKRTAAAEYDVRRAKFAAIDLKNDTLVSVCAAEDGSDQFCLTREGMMIRFKTEEVPAMGRTSKGVKAIKLAPGDIVCWAGNLSNSDQLILFSERGYAKRLMGSMSDTQGRGGKGVHAFYFNKSGSNGSYVAAFARLSEPRSFSVLQKQGELTPLTAAEIAPQDLTDRGKPYVLALLDNVVTDIVL